MFDNYVTSIILCGIVTAYILAEMANVCFLWANDKKHESLTRKYCPWLIKNSSWDEGAWICWPILLYALAFVLGFAWPLVIFLILCGTFLFSLRWILRIKRTLLKKGYKIDCGDKEREQDA